MSDDIHHECAVAMVVLRKPPCATADFGGSKLSLLLEKQHNRGQDGAGAAILSANPAPGAPPYKIFKSASATPLADLLGMIAKRDVLRERGAAATPEDVGRVTGSASGTSRVSSLPSSSERVFLGHLRYATFGKNDLAYCHPFVHAASDLKHTLLLAGNFNLTNATELFDGYSRAGAFPTSRADGYLITSLIARELENENNSRAEHPESIESDATDLHVSKRSAQLKSNLPFAISRALKDADGAWTLVGATGDGWAFATRDPRGIRPGFYYIDENAVVVASERPAIQAAFDVSPEAVKELPPGKALVVSPQGETSVEELNVEKLKSFSRDNLSINQPDNQILSKPCSFERIYFSRANDADIHRERKALGAALLPRILEAAGVPLEDIFFSFIPNSARIAFHGLLEELFGQIIARRCKDAENIPPPRFGEVIVKDAKFRTFIADAAARREFYKHVYDVTYGLVRPGKDTLVVVDDSIVRGNTMKNAILPMLDRLGPKRIVIASSAPPVRYPDCYGIDMSTLGELVAFKALVNLLGSDAEGELRRQEFPNPLAALYGRFTEKRHASEIARLLTPPGMKAEVVVVYQSVENLKRCLVNKTEDKRHTTEDGDAHHQRAIGDWYFTGDYPTPGGYKVLHTALGNYLARKNERSY